MVNGVTRDPMKQATLKTRVIFAKQFTSNYFFISILKKSPQMFTYFSRLKKLPQILTQNILKGWIGLDFVLYRSQNLTQPILKSFFIPNLIFKP
jgi:hypothetical protein